MDSNDQLVLSLKTIFDNHGRDVFKKPELILAWLMDYNPERERIFCEYKEIIMLGVTEDFLNNIENDSFNSQAFFDYEISNKDIRDRERLVEYINILGKVFYIDINTINHEKNEIPQSKHISLEKEESGKNKQEVSGEDYYKRAESFKRNGIVEDEKEYIKYLDLSSDNNYLRATHLLAHYYIKGKYVEKNSEKGMMYLRRCVELGDYGSAFEIYTYEKSIDYPMALNYLKMAADKGIVQAEFEYGLQLYEKGNMNDEAVRYFAKASEGNHSYAMYYLALCYQLGRGIEKDTNKAKIYLSKAADLGLSKAREVLEGL